MASLVQFDDIVLFNVYLFAYVVFGTKIYISSFCDL